jgi:galactitol-specific phosphotransferase system IIC component
VNGSPSTCVSAAAAFGLAATFGSVVAISSRVSKAYTWSVIAIIPHCTRSSVVSVDAWDLWNISFKGVVVLLNVSFMDAVNDSSCASSLGTA